MNSTGINKGRILVTGSAGYIGSLVTRQLLEKGYQVRGLDALFFGGSSVVEIAGNPNFEFVRGDVRDRATVSAALDGVNGVIHLAAIVGDPACAKQPELSEEINWTASKQIYDLAASKGVERFIFASTCSNYGRMEGDSFITETSPLRPISLYAKLKVRFEEYLFEQAPKHETCVTVMRFATVYGLSPRVRFDLTVNEFIRDMTKQSKLVVFGEQFWRPYCHVADLAGGTVLALESSRDLVSSEVFGVGDTGENYQKQTLAILCNEVVPSAVVEYVKKDEDPRDYRVDFTKIKTKLGFQITKRVPEGIREIHNVLVKGIIEDPYAPQYRNI